MSWTSSEVRRRFLEFFAERGHRVCSSYPLVPPNDPSLMFTNAGMVQFKDVFTGKETKPYSRAASSQKCIRISGKHNDLENVGVTSRHHTFFEMLGNFSFGDYFKKEACRFAWDLITDGFALERDRLWCSVHESDDEAFTIWRDEVGVPRDRIFRLGDKDNFWAMGDTGPCGPCSEVLYDRGDAFGPADPENGERFFELWNLVFMQFQVDEPSGPRRPLPSPSIDTGAGLERIVSVLQGVASNYDTDLFRPLIELAAEIAGVSYGASASDDISLRVIADHARMTAFVVAEGIMPDRKERQYVLRRVMRRAVRHGHRLGIEEPFLHRVASRVVDMMGEQYPELVERRELIERVALQEETLFRKTLSRGLAKLRANEQWIDVHGERLLPGHVAYDLYQQDGFPKDLIEVIGLEQGFRIDEEGWLAAEARHKEASRGDAAFSTEIDPVLYEVRDDVGTIEFVGYERERAHSEIAAILAVDVEVERDGSDESVAVRGRSRSARIEAGRFAEVVTYVTPCYGEAGGQVGDRGWIKGDGFEARILDTSRPLDMVVHLVNVTHGAIGVGDAVWIEVDHQRRAAIRRNHSATHLLHWALRKVVGTHATQRGSVVAPEMLRFDFSHGEQLTADELLEIEDLANDKVLANVAIETEITTLAKARERGAMSLFEEKYGEKVRMVRISADSMELCGGTHASRSGDIGLIKVIRQESVGAGVRRIYAVTGTGVTDYIRRLEASLDGIGLVVREADRDLVRDRVERLDQERRQLAKEIDELRRKLATGNGHDVLDGARTISGVKVVARRLPVGEPKAMMDASDAVRDRLGSGAALLAAEYQGKAALVLVVTKDLNPRLDAVELIRKVAPCVGARGGGGRPDLARTGGPNPGGLDDALSRFFDEVTSSLTEPRDG
jgi:alanyl-tRNA synthetase